MEDLRERNSEMEFSATAQKLENALEQLRQEEMRRYGKKLKPEETGLLEEMTKSLLQRVLRQPLLQLQAACCRGETGPLMDSLTELFDLKDHPAATA
ncbi:hypothetical protein [Hymenobacter cellulosivorans]|uniref:Tetrapyrrole biosynthesis glutamyl-tRNA reductase dimerisation domain-containing protein n=1 Tax=Hymenobacter cellulosivorans TaxID=2932249 RepID=A0ABY4FCN0_9BACT|nr:hypothetical protein [Hymenobacter cellulosivorans]UOQ54319.1 hypothetical protein MUN80_06060 [Hymenobacter cellulosivorans]